ncbi:hypothetical protein GCM10022197_28450 [Microlunatus spumicola]|uniref:Uncharacterized protein n=1 Tax=Microlunatus spumicola TaxID=81499 RepID=A0ABP6XP87_9ACTN
MMGSAAIVGLVAGAVVGILCVFAPLFVRALLDGGSLGQALMAMAITDSEDWELIPVFLGGALVVGALTSVAAVVVWWAITTRVPGQPWVARLGAAVSAAAACLLMLAGTTNLSIAVPAAVAAGVVAAVAAPLVGFDRSQRSAAST